MCLEHLLGVPSKIMFVSTGAEMRTKGRDLLHHFQTQGTPIMIGEFRNSSSSFLMVFCKNSFFCLVLSDIDLFIYIQ